MPNIQVLDQITIDKIAAGEVIERPASIVKELVENAIDAKATSVTVEIREGGISFIRITDNGCGIPKEEVSLAFLRHSTSKIRSEKDLATVTSLGFRGEALSSISAISQVEVITKTKESDFGVKYTIEGGVEKGLEEIGAPEGTTFLVNQIFYNTPARRKFLKTPMTEASHVNELMIRLALSHPEVSVQFINNGQSKFHTSGNGNVKDVIYHVFGREIANNLLEINYNERNLRVSGYIGKPMISRGNRNYENYYINGRYVKSDIIAKAIEDGYKDFTMQHRYPFTVLHFWLDGNEIDVNVHPTKMELRFSHQQEIYNFVYQVVKKTLIEPELIPRVELPKSVEEKSIVETKAPEKHDEAYFMRKMKERVESYHRQASQAEVKDTKELHRGNMQIDRIKEAVTYNKNRVREDQFISATVEKPKLDIQEKPKIEQLNFFDEKLLTKKASQEYTVIGQVFDTYWLVEFKEQLYIIDQHAAHERVLYEKTLHGMKNRTFTSQYLSPPIILNLSMQETRLLTEHMDLFTKIGFEIENFGGDSFAVRAVPDNLFSIAKKELLMEMLDRLSDDITSAEAPDIIGEKIASMSCKAAVKGNTKLSAAEVDALIGELLELENPYHCPHGRPTIIAMTKRELEKKFKRIV